MGAAWAEGERTMRTILHLLSEAISRGECAALVIGGYSLEAYGLERPTKDIDLLVAASGLPALAALLTGAGYQEVGRNNTCARYLHENLLHLPVDLLFVDSATWEKLWQASEAAMIEGAALRVPAPLHLIALKLHALKQNPGGRDQDFSDIVRVIHRRSGQIPRDELRALCKRYGPQGIHDQILAALPSAL
jgi:hypothetical protein